MARLFGNRNLGRELPRPTLVTLLLYVFAALAWLIGLGGLGFAVAGLVPAAALPSWVPLLGAGAFVAACLLGAAAMGLALVVKYQFSTAVSSKLTERTMRDALQKGEGASPGDVGESASHEEVVSLLAEIMENTLLDDEEKGAKRQLAKKHRQQALRREIEALINAAKYREAQERLEEFRIRYAEAEAIAELEARLSEALRQHEQTEIVQITEQVERYMGLGLWERAMEMARGLSEQYPENPHAAQLPETVRLEQQADRREEQQRLYREIEHLAARRHWRQALRIAETLLESHPDSPEAHTLTGQMDELKRNAAIMERREWESRITEHIQTGRHHEAYNLAVELMEKYPDSPQARDIRARLDQLKARAGIEA